jgi:L-ribulose-5-phosphate 3-epimerase
VTAVRGRFSMSTEERMSERDVSRRTILKTLGSIPVAAAVFGAAKPLGVQASAVPAATQTAGVAPLRTLTIVSRHLEWASMEEGAAAAAEGGFRAVAWTCRPAAHILPENVERELPRAMEIARQNGLTVPMLITNVNAASSTRAEAVLDTMQKVGISRYRAPGYSYDLTKDLEPQWDQMRRRLDGLARLNEKYGTRTLFHTQSGAGSVGGGLWDLWTLVKDYPVNLLGINYDIGHNTVRGGTEWIQTARFAHKHIGALSLKDMHWVKRTDVPPNQYPWRHEFVVPGQGMVNFRDIFMYMKSVHFDGPMEMYFEYMVDLGGGRSMNMLGSRIGWKLEMPKAQFIALLKRDVDFYRGILDAIDWQVG